jgi:hypothetical protein
MEMVVGTGVEGTAFTVRNDSGFFATPERLGH